MEIERDHSSAAVTGRALPSGDLGGARTVLVAAALLALAASTRAAALPDLTVGSVTGSPTAVSTSDFVTITDSVQATGGGTSTPFTVQYYLSTDALITSSDLALCSRVIAGLGAGETSIVATSCQVPPSATARTYYVGAIVDRENVVAEAVETNNWAAGNQIAVSRPDLTVSSLASSPASVSTSDEVVIADTVAAAGGSTPARFVVQYYLSVDTSITTADTPVCTRTVDGLSAGMTSSATTACTVPPVAPRVYYLGAIVDSGNAVPESSETNNAKVGNTIAVGIDLTVSSVAAAPTALSTSDHLTVSDVVTATNGATATPFTVQYYLSTDATVTTADTALCSRVVAGLSTGETSAETTICQVPPSMTARAYYVGAIVDRENVVAEAVETNNGLAGNQVTVSRPDLTVSSVVGSPSSLGTSDPLAITDTVAATGGSTPVSFVVQYYLSTDTSITSADTPVCTRRVDGLSAGATSTATTTCALPALAPRTYYLGAIVDSGNGVPESSETNNAKVGNTIAVGIDLTVSSVAAAPTALSTSDYLTVSDVVTATNGATATPFTVQYYLSTDATITTADTALCSRMVAGLGTGETSAGTTSCQVPPSMTARAYYVGAIVDSGSAIQEAVETNNWASGNQVTVSRPDLTVSSVVGSPTSLSTSDELVITDTVAATGGSTPASFVVQYYLSTDASITSADTPVCTRTVGGLSAGATSTATTTCAVPALAPRTYYLGAIVDSGNTVPESSESNNAKSGNAIALGLDLVVASVTGSPAALSPSESLTVSDSVTARNGGTGTSFTVAYYLSADATINASDTPLCSRLVPGLAPGETSTATMTCQVPPAATPRTYYLGVIVDGEGAVAEAVETNNAVTGPQIVVTRPDLTVTSLSGSPLSVSTSDELVITDTVAAAGGNTPATFVIQFYLSTDMTITSADTPVCTRSVDGLSAGATSTATTTCPVPAALAPRTYYLGAIVDSQNVVLESSETNNARVGTAIAVTLPDLRVASLAGSPNVVSDLQDLTILDEVAATGGGTATPFIVQYYLSADASITEADTAICARTVAALAAGTSSSGTTTCAIPPALAPGQYYLGAIVDATAVVPEAVETNNATAGGLLWVGRPDLAATGVTGAPATLTIGEVLTIEETVVAHDVPAGPFLVAYYLSSDAAITPADLKVGERLVGAGMSAGETRTGSIQVSAHDGLVGTWYVGVLLDMADAVSESNEANNASAGNVVVVAPPPARPDLVVTNLQGEGTAAAGETYAITCQVANSGDGAAAMTSVDLLLSADDVITPDDVVVGVLDAPALEAAGQVTLSGSVTIPSLATGTYRIIARVDPLGLVGESDESNNVLAGSAFTVAGPDYWEPDVWVTSPPQGTVTNAPSITLVVGAWDDVGVRDVSAAGVPLALQEDGSWNGTVELVEGENVIDVVATDYAGNAGFAVTRVGRDTTPPALSLEPTEPTVDAPFLALAGSATDEGAVAVFLAGEELQVWPGGRFDANVALEMGVNIVTIGAVDLAGNAASLTFTVTRVDAELQVEITEPPPGFVIAGATVPVSGIVRGDERPLSLLVNGATVSVRPDGTFHADVALGLGASSIRAVVTDAAGATAQASVAGERSHDAGGGTGEGCRPMLFVHDAVGNLTGVYDTCADPKHCGAIGNACASSPEVAAACQEGVCGFTVGSEFIDVDSDPLNCGAVGHVCPTSGHGEAVCRFGACELICEPAWERFGDACLEGSPDRVEWLEIVAVATSGSSYVSEDTWQVEPPGRYWYFTPETYDPVQLIRFDGRALGRWTISDPLGAFPNYPDVSPCRIYDDYWFPDGFPIAYSRQGSSVPSEVALDYGAYRVTLQRIPVITSVSTVKGDPPSGTITFIGRNLDGFTDVQVMQGGAACGGGGGMKTGKVIAASSTSITVSGAGWWPDYGWVKLIKNVPWSNTPIWVWHEFVPPSTTSPESPPDPIIIPLPAPPNVPGGCTNGVCP